MSGDAVCGYCLEPIIDGDCGCPVFTPKPKIVGMLVNKKRLDEANATIADLRTRLAEEEQRTARFHALAIDNAEKLARLQEGYNAIHPLWIAGEDRAARYEQALREIAAANRMDQGEGYSTREELIAFARAALEGKAKP